MMMIMIIIIIMIIIMIRRRRRRRLRFSVWFSLTHFLLVRNENVQNYVS